MSPEQMLLSVTQEVVPHAKVDILRQLCAGLWDLPPFFPLSSVQGRLSTGPEVPFPPWPPELYSTQSHPGECNKASRPRNAPLT